MIPSGILITFCLRSPLPDSDVFSTQSAQNFFAELSVGMQEHDGPREATPMAVGGMVGGAVGGTVAYVGVPMAVNALGFTAEGIVAGSTAAGMMSTAAVAEGGGVATGSTVAMLQSIGATGALGVMTGPVIIAGVAFGARRFWCASRRASR